MKVKDIRQIIYEGLNLTILNNKSIKKNGTTTTYLLEKTSHKSSNIYDNYDVVDIDINNNGTIFLTIELKEGE